MTYLGYVHVVHDANDCYIDDDAAAVVLLQQLVSVRDVNATPSLDECDALQDRDNVEQSEA